MENNLLAIDGLQVLDKNEVENISAGSFWLGVAGGLLASFVYDTIRNWDETIESAKAGWRDGAK